ncbi:MAG: exonuclease subunit SbcD, partial [Chloroflexi bacterium]|nr:exonuclease subunit SbcD [Chloroflexota bacterium]
MKILHFADTHIGVETYGTLDPSSGLSTRVLDELKALDTVLDYAVDNKVDLVLFCGDAYKSREPSQTHQREFARRIRRLSEAAIPTVIVVGNHDIPGSPGKANSVEIFETLDIEHIYIANRP